MKIAHVVCSYLPYFGGMGQLAFHMASELTKRGHTVEVITPQKGEPEEETVSYANRLRPRFQYGNAANLPQITKELDRFDIVHLHYPFFGTANLVRKWKKNHPNKPLVVTYHMDTRGTGWKGLYFAYYNKFWMGKILGSADVLLVNSFDFLSSSQASSLAITHKDKWSEMPFGVDLERFSPREKPSSLFLEHDLDINAPTFLFVGGMDSAHYFKGVGVFLKALKILKRQGLSPQVVFVGDGNLKEDFIIQAKGYGLASHVRFVGRISDEMLPYYYNMADLLVLPSINQGEAFGMVLLESMASGGSVLASDLPGVRTVANKGGVVVRPNDVSSLVRACASFLALHPSDKETLAKEVRRVAEDVYSWDRVGNALDALYTRLVSGV